MDDPRLSLVLAAEKVETPDSPFASPEPPLRGQVWAVADVRKLVADEKARLEIDVLPQPGDAAPAPKLSP